MDLKGLGALSRALPPAHVSIIPRGWHIIKPATLGYQTVVQSEEVDIQRMKKARYHSTPEIFCNKQPNQNDPCQHPFQRERFSRHLTSTLTF